MKQRCFLITEQKTNFKFFCNSLEKNEIEKTCFILKNFIQVDFFLFANNTNDYILDYSLN